MSLALWGQDVASQSHVASSGGGWPAGQQPCFAYRGAPGTVVVSAYAQRAAADTGGEHPALLPAPRVFTLPVRHTVSCLTMHPSKPLLAIGTNDHGAFVVPLFNTVKGVALGDTTPPATTSSAATGSSEGQPQQCDASSMALFSLDAKFINATSGNMVLAMTFLAGPSSNVPLLALCTSKRHPPAQPASGNAVHPQQPSGPAAASVFISLWGIEGSVARTLLWCSPPLADQSANTILALRASPERSTMVLCTRKELSLWRVAVGAGATSNQSRPTSGQSSASSQPVVLDVKHRPCSTIPELRGAEFVGIATPPLASHDSDDATTGSPTSGTVAASSAAASEHVFGLTTAGFLVCYDRNDGSIVKWMDCKVCPASSLACTSTHVVVCGATVRFFSLHSWDFCGKVAVDGGGPTASMDTSSAASGYLASLLRGLSVAVAATRHAACVFFGNGNTTHFRLTQGAEGKKKLTIAKCLTVPAFDAASLLNNDVRFLPSAHHTGGPPVVAWSSIQIRSMQPTTLMPLSLKELETTCAVVVALPISRRSSHAVTGEIAVTTVASKGTTPPTSATTTAHVLVAFDTTFHGIVVVSLVDGLRVLGQLPVDHTVNAFVALPVTPADGQDGIEGGDGSALEAVVLAVHNTVPSQVARFTLRGVCDAFGGLERVEIVLQHCRPLRRPVALQSAPLAAQSSSSSASAAVDESLSLVCTASGILCAVMGYAMWNVRTGAVLQLPFRSTAQHTSFAVCNERILIATDTESTLCIVDPTVPNEFRMFVFPTPFPCAPSGLVVDGGTHQVACLRAGTQSEIAVLNMRQKCCEVDRIVPSDTLPGHASNVPQPQVAAESEVVGRRCAGQAYFHSVTFYSGGSALVLLEGTHGGVARLKVVPLSTTTTASPQGTSAPLVSPAPTPGPAVKKDRVPSTSPKNPTSRVGRVRVVEAIPAKEQHHVDPGDMPRNAPKYTATHRRRTMSCGATPEVAELEERYAELRQIADGMPSGTTSKSSRSTTNRRVPTTTAAPDLQSQGPSLARAGALGAQLQQQDDPSSALCCVGTRRNDPFRQSGLLLTKQVHESKGGDVVLRLGLRWGDMSHDLGSGGATPTKSTAGPGAPRSKRVLNLPVVRSHNSSITSAVDQSDDHDDLAVPPSGPSQQRPFADPSYATELLLRRMKQRDAAACGGATTQGGEHPAPLGGKHKYEVAHQGNGDIVAVAVGTIEDAVRGSNVDVTDSLAQQLLANERSKIALPSLDAATAVAAAGCKESKAAQLPALQQPVGATVEDGEGHHHGPHRCNASPLKGKNEVVVFHRTAGDDEDFVVCGSVADVPAAVVAANRHQDPFAANPHRHDSFAGVGDDDEDASDVAYVQARTMTAGASHPARAAFAATFHASSSSSMADGINNARPPPSRGPTMRGTLQHQGGGAGSRASDIKRAAERVRESLASLREILLTDDGGDTAGGTEPQDETDEDNEVSMQELNAVLADVVSTMLATSQRSRPSSAASNVPRSLSSRGVAGPSRRLTDDTPDVAASVAASTMTATSATTSAAASAVQFHLLWSEMQRLQTQNASILAAVQVVNPKTKQQIEGGAGGSQK